MCRRTRPDAANPTCAITTVEPRDHHHRVDVDDGWFVNRSGEQRTEVGSPESDDGHDSADEDRRKKDRVVEKCGRQRTSPAARSTGMRRIDISFAPSLHKAKISPGKGHRTGSRHKSARARPR